MTSFPDRLPYVWGATRVESHAQYLGDRFAAPGSARMVRAVDTSARREDLWTWLCQMRVAPYSYDWIDNLGRRSPRTADPALCDLEVGQTFAKIFDLVDFTAGDSITMVTKPGRPTTLFGQIVMTYAIRGEDPQCRLVGVLEVAPTGGVAPRLRRSLLGWGDLIMMRKQLNTLAHLAETSRPV